MGVAMPASRSDRHTARPSLPGSMMSSTIRSSPPSRARRSAVSPSPATSTSNPSRRRSSLRPIAIAGSSSPTRIFTVSLPGVGRTERRRDGGARARFALDGDGRIVRIGHVLDDGEAEAGAFDGRGRLAAAEETVEHAPLLVARNTDAAVADAHAYGAALARFRFEFDCGRRRGGTSRRCPAGSESRGPARRGRLELTGAPPEFERRRWPGRPAASGGMCRRPRRGSWTCLVAQTDTASAGPPFARSRRRSRPGATAGGFRERACGSTPAGSRRRPGHAPAVPAVAGWR